MFNQVAKRKLIVLISTLTICFSVIIINNLKENNKLEKKEIYQQKEVIIDEAQFIFKPIYEYRKKSKQMKFLVEITSYINEEIINLNYKKIAALEIEEHIFQPIDFKVIEKTNHKLIGHLVFEINKLKKNQPFGIKVFTFSENEVNWN